MDNNIMRTQDLDISDLNLQEEDEKILNAVEKLNSSEKDNNNLQNNDIVNEDNNEIKEDETDINEEEQDINEIKENEINNNTTEEDINEEEQDTDEINENEIDANKEDINEEEDNNEIKENEIDVNEEKDNEIKGDNNEEDINLDDIQNHVLNLNTSSSDNKEEILKVLAKAGITANISIKTSKQRITDKLIYEDENDKTMATCRANPMHVFNITELNEEDQKRVKKHGLCLHCLNILEQANEIKQAIGQIRLSNNSSSNSSTAKGISAGQQIRKIFTNAISQYSDKDIMNFTDKNYSLQHFKLAYPLLLDITSKSAAEIKILKLDKKGHPRYSPRIYTINNKQYLMTNDLYSKNLEKFKETFKALNFITEEDEEDNNEDINNEE